MSISTDFFVPLYTDTSSLDCSSKKTDATAKKEYEEIQKVQSAVSDCLYRHTFGAAACLIKGGIYLVGAALLTCKTALKILIAPVASPIVCLIDRNQPDENQSKHYLGGKETGRKQSCNSFTLDSIANDFLAIGRTFDFTGGAAIQTVCGAHKKSRSILEACKAVGKLILGIGSSKGPAIPASTLFHMLTKIRPSWSKMVFDTDELYDNKEVTETLIKLFNNSQVVQTRKDKIQAP